MGRGLGRELTCIRSRGVWGTDVFLSLNVRGRAPGQREGGAREGKLVSEFEFGCRLDSVIAVPARSLACPSAGRKQQLMSVFAVRCGRCAGSCDRKQRGGRLPWPDPQPSGRCPPGALPAPCHTLPPAGPLPLRLPSARSREGLTWLCGWQVWTGGCGSFGVYRSGHFQDSMWVCQRARVFVCAYYV